MKKARLMPPSRCVARFRIAAGRTFSRRAASAAVLTLSGSLALAAATDDAARQLASFSVFNKVDFAQLVTEAKTVAGPAMRSPRFASVQSCWVAPRSPHEVVAALRAWDPARHPESKVYFHANGENFDALRNVPDRPGVRALVQASLAVSPELQISKGEAARFSRVGPLQGLGAMPPIVGLFWKTVLTKRAAAFLDGGSAAQPSYDHTGQEIRPNEELSGMLAEQPKLRRRFATLLENSRIGRGAAGDPQQFWQLRAIDNKAVLTLGAFYERNLASEAQAATLFYYATGGYYAAVTFYEMWPVEVDGNAATLVWRGDLVSSPRLAGANRAEVAAELRDDVAREVRLLREEIAGPEQR
jgi:hypothetical protein